MTVEEYYSDARGSERLRVSRVKPRDRVAQDNNEKAPTPCILIDKEEVRALYRYILNEPTWDYPVVEEEDMKEDDAEK